MLITRHLSFSKIEKCKLYNEGTTLSKIGGN
nr:MAG TPA: hypothetical protein [Caudoviricetes sp.]